jgi:lipid-A-disaccharide synthase
VGAGEASGDHIAALILQRMRAHHPDLVVQGFGGPLCAAEGLNSWYPLSDLAVNGLGDVIRRGVFLLRARAALVRHMETFKPDVVLLVDYPGMNVPLARRARALGIPVHYVAPPQLWAYKNAARRRARLRRALDGVSLQVLFPFEGEEYPHWSAPVTQGHFFPLPAFEPSRGTRLLLCPGSRRGVLRRNLPLWLTRVHAFFGTLDGVDILVPEYLAADARVVCGFESTRCGDEAKGPTIVTEPEAAFANAGAAIAFPGTITLELFLQRIPTRVWGVLDPLTLLAGRRTLRGPHVALPNVLAHRGGLSAVCPEWIGTAADFRRDPPAIPPKRADWSPQATAESLAAVWALMGSDRGVEVALTLDEGQPLNT